MSPKDRFIGLTLRYRKRTVCRKLSDELKSRRVAEREEHRWQRDIIEVGMRE